LATIATNSDLGAGMAVAMKDLEIRGAGNLLGGEQSGHIAEVGFDLYVRLVSEAVAEFRGIEQPEPAEVRIELPVDAHLPHDYVPGERLRLDVYRRLAEAVSEPAVDAMRAELVDRCGAPPEPVENLLEVARFRIQARSVGLTEITVQGKYVRLGPVELAESRQVRLNWLYPGSVVKPQVRTILVPRPGAGRIGAEPVRGVDLLRWCRRVVGTVIQGEDVGPATASP
jgi:transcription-repair coupling factor (superfamily II helicase)